MKKLRTEVVLESDEGDPDWIPSDFAGIQQWMDDQFVKVPAEFRHTARVSFEADNDPDFCRVCVRVSYLRYETDEEEAARESVEASGRARLREMELRQLAVLKSKYEITEPAKRAPPTRATP